MKSGLTQCDWLQAARKFRGVPHLPYRPLIPAEEPPFMPPSEPAAQEEPEPVPPKPGRKKKTVKALVDLSDAGDGWSHGGHH